MARFDDQRRSHPTNGILQNELYIGQIVHNRTRRDIDPETRRRVIKSNPPEKWRRTEAPDLRIIDQDTWNAVTQRRQCFDGVKQHQQRRPKRLLSRLAVCGVCGGSYNVISTDKWGCGRNRDGRGCSNNRTIENGTFEKRVLGGLKDRLLAPDLVAVFVAEFEAEQARLGKDADKDRSKLEREHAKADNKVKRIVDLLVNGGAEFPELKDELRRARAYRDSLAAELAERHAAPVVALNPNIIDEYRSQVADLTKAPEGGDHARLEAVPALRSLIDRIIIAPASAGRGVDIEVTGRLASVIAIAAGKGPPDVAGMERMLKVVPLA